MLISHSPDSSHPRSPPRDSQHHHREACQSSTLSSKRSRNLSAADSQRNIPRQRFFLRRRRAQPPPGPHRSSYGRLVSRPRQYAASHGMCDRACSAAISDSASKPHDGSATRNAADAAPWRAKVARTIGVCISESFAPSCSLTVSLAARTEQSRRCCTTCRYRNVAEY